MAPIDQINHPEALGMLAEAVGIKRRDIQAIR
jgi:hypothetical protein